jgi:hypothetical protein
MAVYLMEDEVKGSIIALFQEADHLEVDLPTIYSVALARPLKACEDSG